MEQAGDIIYQIGKAAFAVIAVCVVVMLLISLVDRHPRGTKSGDRKDPND